MNEVKGVLLVHDKVADTGSQIEISNISETTSWNLLIVCAKSHVLSGKIKTFGLVHVESTGR